MFLLVVEKYICAKGFQKCAFIHTAKEQRFVNADTRSLSTMAAVIWRIARAKCRSPLVSVSLHPNLGISSLISLAVGSDMTN
jgi:hypothetical protein